MTKEEIALELFKIVAEKSALWLEERSVETAIQTYNLIYDGIHPLQREFPEQHHQSP